MTRTGERLLDLSDQLVEEVSRPLVALHTVREIAMELARETEEHAIRLRQIHDIAKNGHLTIRTGRWLRAYDETAPSAETLRAE